MPDETFEYDVFLCHSPKDREVVRTLAERLRGDGVRVWYPDRRSTSVETEDALERSRVLVLCMSRHALGEDWAELERQTFRFRDALNQERRFVLLRLDETERRDSLAPVLCLDFWAQNQQVEYSKLLAVSRDGIQQQPAGLVRDVVTETTVRLDVPSTVYDWAFHPDGRRVLSAGSDDAVRLWEVETGRCLHVLNSHTRVGRVAWSPNGRYILCDVNNNTVQVWEMETGRRLRVLKGHSDIVGCVAWAPDGERVLSGTNDGTVYVWEVKTERRLRLLKGHTASVKSVAWSPDGRWALSGGLDAVIRLWDVETGHCLRVMKGHTPCVVRVAWSPDGRWALSSDLDAVIRLWEVETGRCHRVLEGHTECVWSVVWSPDGRYALSGSFDRTVRLWDVQAGRCVCVMEGHPSTVRSVAWSPDGRRAFSGDSDGNILVRDLLELVSGIPAKSVPANESQVEEVEDNAAKVLLVGDTSEGKTGLAHRFPVEEIEYTNAKVLLVGDTSAGKTGLAHRLATGQWRPSDGSTVGAWSTQWALPEVSRKDGVDREIWLWDFGGQADQRLVHQLYMDRTALILLLFDADKEDVLPGLREWQTALKRCVDPNTVQFLVAGRTDAGFRASRAKLQKFAEEHGFRYHETSAMSGLGCQELQQAIVEGIPWGEMERRTSPRIFKRIKDEILKLRDEGQVLLTFKELREVLRPRLEGETGFTDPVLQTAIGLLAGPGAVQELEYGTYVLLQPEWINAYAQAVIRTLRQDASELGCLPLRSIAEGNLLFQTVDRDGSVVEVKRLLEVEERVVLREMERQLEERGLCLRQGDKLVFPSHCGQDRPEVQEFPAVCISYAVRGYLDDLYATLVVKLADGDAFLLKQLWRDAADFDTLTGGHRMGVKLSRTAAGYGEISVHFGAGVTQQEQVIFANYIHAHLEARSEQVQRLRHYVCPNCGRPKENPLVLWEKLRDRKHKARVVCDYCDEPFSLWDDLERLFASPQVRAMVEGMEEVDATRLDLRRRNKLLALEVNARITKANQLSHEVMGLDPEGIDLELQFTDSAGQGREERLYLQLKCGNAHLRKREDGTEVFAVEDQRWVGYWLKQAYPVMLVVGTFPEVDARFGGREKLGFADVRWMEISSVLRRLSDDGRKPVTQIEFTGERLDLTSVMRWRDQALGVRR